MSAMPDDIRRLVERDRLLYGTGYARQRPDGSWEHIPATEVFVALGMQPTKAYYSGIPHEPLRTWTRTLK